MYFLDRQQQELSRSDFPTHREPDFEAFWRRAAERVAQHDSRPAMTLLADYPCRHLKIYDVTVHGLDGTPVKAWLYLPEEASPECQVPGVGFFHGGSGSRGKYPGEMIKYALTGCAVLQTEFRLQGGVTSSATPMRRCANSFSTYNLDCADPVDNYFYHAFTDQLLMVKFLFSRPEVNPEKVAVMGASQGGGTALILSALEPRIALCLAAVPSYCCWERRVFTRTACASAIADFIEKNPECAEQVFRVLSYFDAANFAPLIRCRTKMQIALRDSLAPADCAFTAYNRLTCRKELLVNPMGEHGDVDYERWMYDLAELAR